MNTYYFQNDNSIRLTRCTSVITEQSSSVDIIRVIVPKYYNEVYDMSGYDALLEYRLPVSKKIGLFKLTLADDNYKSNYLLYTLPNVSLKLSMTKEAGDVEFCLIFVKVVQEDNGGLTLYRRNSSDIGVIKISELPSWVTSFDDESEQESEIQSIIDLYVANKETSEELKGIADQLTETKLDNIALDTETGKITGVVNGEEIEGGINLGVLNKELVKAGANEPSNGNLIIRSI